jgi:hypothetical protein
MRTGLIMLSLLVLGCGEVLDDDSGDPGGIVGGGGDAATGPDAAGSSDGGPVDAGGSPDACLPGVTVTYTATALPQDISGFYDEAFDCARDEGGAWLGNVDFEHCFRKSDGSSWRIWNTGCGWEIGLITGGEWQRHARYYTGQCSQIPAEGLTTEALTTSTFFDGFGDPISNLTSSFEPCS